MFENRFFRRNLRNLCIVTLPVIAGMPAAAAFDGDLRGATQLSPNAVLRGYTAATETLVLRLELPAPGIATVDLVGAPANRVPAKIEPGSSTGVTILEQSATHLALAAHVPGSLLLRVGTEHPHLPLGRFKLTTSFVEARLVEEAFSLAPRVFVTRTSFLAAGVETKGDPEDVDPDPGSLILPGGRRLASLTTLYFSSPAEKGDPEDVDPDPGSFTAPSPGDVEQVSYYAPTCRQAELDDHGDTMACATPVVMTPAASVAGEIGNGHGDDVDVFVLTFPELTTVELTTTGDADTFGTLYDRSGQLLATDDDSAGARHFRIVATLAPGRYFVRVEGGGAAEGAYELRVAPVE